jgi:hypothetical protein
MMARTMAIAPIVAAFVAASINECLGSTMMWQTGP